MTWHLKDRELEQKLIAIDSEFSEKLNKECERLDSNNDSDVFIYKPVILSLVHNSNLQVKMHFRAEDVEYILKYNPYAWNEFPKVMPPEDVWMRLEIYPGCENSGRVGAKYVNGKWLLDDGTIENFGNYPARFRPWED